MSVKKNNLILGTILIVAFVLRIFKFQTIPPGVSHDELEYINNGYSIFKTGMDLYGSRLPISIGGVGYVAIPAYVAGLSTAIFGLNVAAARLPAALFGTIEVLLIYGIAKSLFKSEKIAIFSSLVLALSTWGLKMSRVMFDPPTSLFFFLLGIYIFLKASKLKEILLSLTILIVGTISYYGAFFVSPFVIVGLIIYRWKFLKKFRKKLIIYSSIIVLFASVIIGFMLFKPNETSRSSGRAGSLSVLDLERVAAIVDYERSSSTSSAFFNEIFINKGTAVFKLFLSNYLGAFSPSMIFLEGDPNVIYGLWGRGELNILDFPLIILGLFYLHKRSKKGVLLTLFLIAVAPITSGLSGTVYATRAFLMWPLLIILSGSGFAFLYKRKRLLFYLYIPIYLYFTLAAVHQYFFRYSTYASEAWFESEKQLALHLIENTEETDIYSPEARQAFMEYFFFSRSDPRDAQKALTKSNIKADINFGNFKFINGCPKGEFIEKTIVHINCGSDEDSADEIIRTSDGSSSIKWLIYDTDEKNLHK